MKNLNYYNSICKSRKSNQEFNYTDKLIYHETNTTPIRNTKANDVIKPSPAPKTKSLLILYITFKRKSKVKYQDPDHPLERLKYKRRKEYRRGLAPPILFVCVDREKK